MIVNYGVPPTLKSNEVESFDSRIRVEPRYTRPFTIGMSVFICQLHTKNSTNFRRSEANDYDPIS